MNPYGNQIGGTLSTEAFKTGKHLQNVVMLRSSHREMFYKKGSFPMNLRNFKNMFFIEHLCTITCCLVNMRHFVQFGTICTFWKNLKNTHRGFFHFVWIVQMVPNCAKHHIRIQKVFDRAKFLSLENFAVSAQNFFR